MYFRRNRHKHFKYKINLLKIYLNQIQGFGLTNLIIALTRVYIDQVYCLSPEKLISSYILLSKISDYFPFYIKLKNCSFL